jgi:hypothetical protein
MAQRRSPAKSGRRSSNKASNLSRLPEVSTQRGGRTRRLQTTQTFVQAELANPGPWIPVSSSRMREVRYDYGLRAIYVRFRDGTPYVYEQAPLAVFYRLLRASSKGKFVSRVLDTYPYRQATPEEAARPTSHAQTRG